ncbi:hypothetical protein HU765_20240 [Pseudomonas sp. SWRI81]|uniref:hypothetical protein n=1 Tax=Pseudomonas sp. SWRI81 TaxID=2745505 RepID=UPI0016474812|nr:hypothetical protein [Pseudomonas sp. SWRI81]MBC3272272.1 hypothetical protein [Pseudomonas sp. SWRI81]
MNAFIIRDSLKPLYMEVAVNLVNGLLMLIGMLCCLSFYFWLKIKKMEHDEDVQPLDTGLVVWVALVFVLFVVCLFFYFGENKFSVPENIGQIGDFIGGLTNPVLSFLALLVLLRTTLIQTMESRKTTGFMRSQQKLLEEERFENTFFHLLSQLESYCEKHFRDDGEGQSYAEELSETLCENYGEFASLDKDLQMKAAEKHIKEVTDNSLCITLVQRYARVAKFVANSKIDKKLRASYASVLRDTVYPDECILISSKLFLNKTLALVLKEWKLVDASRGYFVCPEIEYFYKGGPPKQPVAESSAVARDYLPALVQPSAAG